MTRRGFTSRHLKFEFMWPQQVTVWYSQRNMHVQYSNTVINILRIIETHINLISAKNGSEAARSASDPRRSRMTSYLGST